MTLFETFAKLNLDTQAFDNGMRKAEKSGIRLKNSLEDSFSKIKKFAAGAISLTVIKKGVDAVMDLATETSNAGDAIDKQSQVLGMSRKAYQEWDYILGQNGASIESMSVSMKTLNGLVVDASNGSKEAKKNAKDLFAQLGISFHEIENMNPEEQFEAVVRAFQKMPAGARKSALAVKFFGRNGMELLPLLNSSSTSIDELRQRAQELGLVMSDELVDASADYNDSLDTLNRTFTAFKQAIVGKLLPVFTSAMNRITSYAGKIRKAYDEKGFAGIFETIVADIKNIKWPTWDDVSKAITDGWNTILEGARNLGGIVFGRKADGSVDWPTWDDVVDAAHNIWNGILEGALTIGKTFGKLMFGTKEDGSVNFPSFEKIKADAVYLWLQIKRFVLDLPNKIGGLIFGRKEDGTVAWPDIDKVMADFDVWWKETAVPALQKGMTWFLTIFGVPQETAEQISKIVSDWWTSIKDTAIKGVKWTLSLPQMPAYEAGERLRKIVSNWWDGVKRRLWNVMVLTVTQLFIEDENGQTTADRIKTWWNEQVAPKCANFINFTLGMLGLPDLSTITIRFAATVTEWYVTINNWARGKTAILFRFAASVTAWFDTISGWVTDQATALINFTATATGWFYTVQEWINNKGTEIAFTIASLPAKADKYLEKIKDWASGKFNSLTFELGSKLAQAETWLQTIKDWLSVATQTIKIDFTSTVDEWIKTIKNWLTEGVKIGVNLVNSLAGEAETEGAKEARGQVINGLVDWGFKHFNPFGHAKGLNTVPFDNYPALLHRGEQVLTASQARRRNNSSSGLNVREFAAAVVGAIREGMDGATVNSYMDGRNMTNSINRRTVNQLKARRFAT